jgi:hypothetical protein
MASQTIAVIQILTFNPAQTLHQTQALSPPGKSRGLTLSVSRSFLFPTLISRV